jgi:hypothetical protein
MVESRVFDIPIQIWLLALPELDCMEVGYGLKCSGGCEIKVWITDEAFAYLDTLTSLKRIAGKNSILSSDLDKILLLCLVNSV